MMFRFYVETVRTVNIENAAAAIQCSQVLVFAFLQIWVSHLAACLPSVNNNIMPVKLKPKNILNDPKNAVDEFIEGLLLQYPNHLVKLANHHVILASKRDPSHVQIFSGGGSGHEPSHAGWIGSAMLTGAVCGGIFASRTYC